MLEPVWLQVEHAVRLNEIVVASSGEHHYVRSYELLNGALERPRNLFIYEKESDLAVLAVRLLVAIGKNHCFEQGNKRTAYHAALSFLRINGCAMRIIDNGKIAELVEGVIIGRKNPGELIELLKSMMPRSTFG